MEVSYSGTATAGTDYSGNIKTHTINSGNTATWSINVKSDNVAEGNETIVVEITSVTNATESGIQIETLTITDAVIIDETVCKQDLTYSGVAPDMWTGCYSTDSDDNAIWEGACKLESVDTSNFVYLHFGVSSECNFDWVRAAGDVGDTWQSLASSSANWSSSEFVIKHTGAKVHELKLCVNGVSGGPPDWCK